MSRVAWVGVVACLSILLGGVYAGVKGYDSVFFSQGSGTSAVADDLFTSGGANPLEFTRSDNGDSAPAAHAMYTSAAYHFSISYPSDFAVNVIEESDGASSFVFENVDRTGGFQIFVTPYEDPVITQARFQMDQPSGALNDPVAIAVDGAQGMMFYTHNGDIGDTVEVWFVKDGFLYEVYTYRSLESLLTDVLGSWRFVRS